MLTFLAALPILIVGVLMIGLVWPSSRAMPLGALAAVLAAAFAWDMPPRWLAAAAIAGVVNALEILLIVFGALLILQVLRKSGGIQGISASMTGVSGDRRVQVVVIAWLMGSFLEGAAGFGTPAAVAAPLLVGMGFPPLIAAAATLMADSASVTFGAVGVPIWGGFSAMEGLADWPLDSARGPLPFREFLEAIGAFAGLLHFAVGTLVPLAVIALMTRVASGSFREGLRAWPIAIIGGLCFTVPQALIAVVVGPELPALLGALIGLPVFLFLVRRGIGVPRERWDFPPREQWPASWEGAVKAGTHEVGDTAALGPVRAWMPYVLIAVLLLAGRLEFFGLTSLLREWTVGWDGILGTTIGKQITPLYNPGVVPFVLVAMVIPLVHPLKMTDVFRAAGETLSMMRSATIALVFTLVMVFVMMRSGDAAGRDSMLLVLAEAAAALAGDFWLLVAPFVGALGTFISGSNTVSNIMFGPFQFDAALAAEAPVVATLALQAVGGAAGNMICIHNVVAVLTTVGLVGREGIIIRANAPVCLAYCLLTGIVGWVLAVFVL